MSEVMGKVDRRDISALNIGTAFEYLETAALGPNQPSISLPLTDQDSYNQFILYRNDGVTSLSKEMDSTGGMKIILTKNNIATQKTWYKAITPFLLTAGKELSIDIYKSYTESSTTGEAFLYLYGRNGQIMRFMQNDISYYSASQYRNTITLLTKEQYDSGTLSTSSIDWFTFKAIINSDSVDFYINNTLVKTVSQTVSEKIYYTLLSVNCAANYSSGTRYFRNLYLGPVRS